MWELLAALVAAAMGNDRVHSTPLQHPHETRRRSVQYRTRDGTAYYGFSIEQQPNGTFVVYIANQPNYGNRSRNTYVTHRLKGADGRLFICWSEPLRTEQEALRVAAAWADGTQDYIKYGRRF